MYTPKHFAETHLGRLHAAIEDYSFATLVSGSGDELEASHLPLLLDRDGGPRGTLIGHMAKANGQWREVNGQSVLAIFHGPHAYVSPAWYEAKEVVPTWNYVAVHAVGKLMLITEPAEVAGIVYRTVGFYEAGRENPWQMDEGAEYIQRLLPQIVGFRIPIDRLEGKWKLNQNHSRQRRQKVVQALSTSPREGDRQIADLVQETLKTGE